MTVFRAKESDADTRSQGYVERIGMILGVRSRSGSRLAESLPFTLNDTTAGSENEFQTTVIGRSGDVDLPVMIEESSYFKNVIRRCKAGEMSKRVITEIEKYLRSDHENTWENSWVRLPRARMSPAVHGMFLRDLAADKNVPDGPQRTDAERFFLVNKGEEWIRIPVSYLLKLSLVDILNADPPPPSVVKTMGEKAADHFLNDNTSPETYSFFPVALSKPGKAGEAIARETSKRFLLTQFLVMYANSRFGLNEAGQRACIYFSPHPPIRQKLLNDIIPDSFYRELFMNPCLSGWDKGEEKHQYMNLCHQVLSRSQLNVIAKLKEAGIITNNLVVPPNVSNISLANNGTHISLGSRRLTALLRDRHSGFGTDDEKYLGDFVIKITEHFLPLFIGSYSASPYRLDFRDFHPEKALGFLPHELDYTHLRMIWRRWLKKADLKVMGHPLTPFGPGWLDGLISKVLCLRGDFVQDFRLVDYLVALMSTAQSPALDGLVGNTERLTKDLANLGVFDGKMAVYLPYRLREFRNMGFSGFEGRFFSLFESLPKDMGAAASLQMLITALGFMYLLSGEMHHSGIPDDPTVESERRQIFFGTAIGIPTFYVSRYTKNLFMRRILTRTKRTRMSRRYPGYVRVYNLEYRRALVAVLEDDGRDLIGLMGLQDIIEDLKERIENPETESAAGRLTKGILGEAGVVHPFDLSHYAFNRAAERYYRERLRKKQTDEALKLLEEDLRNLDSRILHGDGFLREILHSMVGNRSASEYLSVARADILDERAPENIVRTLINLTLLSFLVDQGAEDWRGRKASAA